MSGKRCQHWQGTWEFCTWVVNIASLEMKKFSLVTFFILAACADPAAWENECRSKFSNEAQVSMCVSNAKVEYSQRMENISQALSGMTLQGQQQSGYVAPRRSSLMRTLRGQWLQNGSRMCQYSDGTVMNIGVGVCPTSI